MTDKRMERICAKYRDIYLYRRSSFCKEHKEKILHHYRRSAGIYKIYRYKGLKNEHLEDMIRKDIMNTVGSDGSTVMSFLSRMKDPDLLKYICGHVLDDLVIPEIEHQELIRGQRMKKKDKKYLRYLRKMINFERMEMSTISLCILIDFRKKERRKDAYKNVIQ